ncbi:ABC transporter ATP-binding protein [Paenibacillus sp. XY044]|uniref:ABC transporter ATP-binding protein n=1 Tax=Paenibacillus sp. XY044 TaxID=2026089 RepID=UPI00211B1C6F|nr:ABC transporter ATP-binding protein [Paenibacillus sp. XY044]
MEHNGPGWRKMPAGIILRLEDVSKRYDRRMAAHHITLEIAEGECTALVGKNGSGKSTLLRLLAGLSHPTQGRRLTEAGRSLRVGLVTEKFPALPFTPGEFLMSMGRTRGMDRRTVQSEITEWLKRLGMEPYRDVRMSHFSKGMLQKINLVQAVMGSPRLLLLDEPLSGIDIPSQKEVIRLLMDMKGMGTAMVMSVHEPELINQAADRIVLLENGRIVKEERGFRIETVRYAIILFHGDPLRIRQSLEGIGDREVAWVKEGSESEIHVRTDLSDHVLQRILHGGGHIVSVSLREPSGVDLGELLQTAAAALEGGTR